MCICIYMSICICLYDVLFISLNGIELNLYGRSDL